MLNSDNLNFLTEHGYSLDWFKPHHKNHTRTNDSIALYRFLDTEFYGKIVVGSPGKTFNMVFDTAWRDSWIMSSDCTWKKIGCWIHNKYNHGGSSSYRANGAKFSAKEQEYTLEGYYSYDDFSIAHSKVEGQLFVEMTSVPYTYLFSKADGVIGMGFKTDSNNPFFYNILNQTNISKPLFSIYLNRDKQSNRGGNIILGAIDEKHIHVTDKKPDQITYLPVDKSSGWWQFKMDRIDLAITKDILITYCKNGCSAIADSSSNNIVGPKDEVEKIFKQIHATELFFGFYKVDCDTVNKLPRIHFIIGGKNFTLKGENYVQKLSWNSFMLCITSFVASNTTNLWVLGGAFLSEFYSIYDIEHLQLGLVKAA
ncbi:lysosomal aspartic protease-like [Agrilus planipennis]|uniref:Lysosomal aspartic protease-like n=1 Tax=Agrilus planipennis TaxID=224129 RepID=A0A1W4X8X5_AGRPL|nr:lysosomal aspartic protease-like [Agrilus planipennis]